MRCPKKRTPFCNGTDNGNTVMRKHADFGLVLNHNNECGVKQNMSKSEQRNEDKSVSVRIDSDLNWEQPDWKRVQNTVSRLQARIVKAQKEGKYGKVKSLSRILTKSFAAKALAVRKVTTNRGKHTPGIDGIIWRTSASKAQAILELQQERYRAKPLRRKYIPKSGSNKMRPLGIPTMKDRAMQAVYATALSPIAETTSDLNSYGFRPYRSCQDAIAQIRTIMRHKKRPQWVLEGDIKGCFDNISHEWILENIPSDHKILRQWLKCGYFENDKKFFNEAGTPQGGIISPIIANMVLDGIENMLNQKYKRLYHHKNGEAYWKAAPKGDKQVFFIRYADDFIVTCNSKETLENEIKPMLRNFLNARGLELSEEKTVITSIRDGFDFLGFTIRTYNETLLVTPAEKRIKRLRDKIGDTITRMQGQSAEKLINTLNPIIRGWANYYRYANSSNAFSKLRSWVWLRVWEWAKRQHHNKGARWIRNKYFTGTGKRKWRFQTKLKDGTTLFLEEATDYKMLRHIKIQRDRNPFDPKDYAYFQMREKNGCKLKLHIDK